MISTDHATRTRSPRRMTVLGEALRAWSGPLHCQQEMVGLSLVASRICVLNAPATWFSKIERGARPHRGSTRLEASGGVPRRRGLRSVRGLSLRGGGFYHLCVARQLFSASPILFSGWDLRCAVRFSGPVSGGGGFYHRHLSRQLFSSLPILFSRGGPHRGEVPCCWGRSV